MTYRQRPDNWAHFPRRQGRYSKEAGVRLKTRRGPIGKTWWARRLMELVENNQRFSGQLMTAAKAAARNGRVLQLDVTPGTVVARVQATAGPAEELLIGLPPIPEEAWQRVIEQLSAKAHYVAPLLSGDVPTDIEQVFSDAGAALFPASFDELNFQQQGLPASSGPGRYGLATYMLFVEAADADPFLLFQLRGRPKSDLLAALREHRQADAQPESNGHEPAPAPPPTPEIDPLKFWGEPPSGVSLPPQGPLIPLALLQRIGLPEFTKAPRALWHDLARAYPSGEKYDVSV